MSKSAKNTSKKQNENIILEAELEPVNESKVNLCPPEFNEPAIGDEMTRKDIDEVQYFGNININLTIIINNYKITEKQFD